MFLDWLAADSKDSAEEYEYIRKVLVKIFSTKGFSNAEDLTDKVIDRVISKPDEFKKNFVGNKVSYFVVVARYVELEQRREKTIAVETDKLDLLQTPTNVIDENDNLIVNKKYLRECLKKLSKNNRSIIWDYFNVTKKNKIEKHKKIAEKFSLNDNSLRIKVFRIKKNLAECIKARRKDNND